MCLWKQCFVIIVVFVCCFSHFFVSVCLPFEKLCILTVMFYYLLVLNRQLNLGNQLHHLLENQHQSDTNKSSHTNRGRKLHHRHPSFSFWGADLSYLFQSWRQRKRGLLASPACIIPKFSEACCLVILDSEAYLYKNPLCKQPGTDTNWLLTFGK